MLRLDWSASPRRIAIALVVGVLATAVTARLPLHLVDREKGGQIRSIHRGTHGWWHARDHAWGLRWSNLQLIDPPLTTPLWDGELHGWEEPPPPPYPEAQVFRVGTLASGWPLPVISMRWTETDLRRPFPVPAELDDGDVSIWNATDSALHGNRGGPPKEKRILWAGAAANTIIYAGVLVGPVALIRRIVRSRTAPGDSPATTRRAGGEAAR